MRLIIFIITFLLTFDMTLCQNQDSLKPVPITKNNIYFEIFGNGIIYSLNYEKIIYYKGNYCLSGRLGICGLFGNSKGITMPFLVNGLYRLNNKLQAEIGVGITLINIHSYDKEINPITQDKDSEIYNTALVTSLIGVRYQDKKGFLIRIGFTPFLSLHHTTSGLWFGASIGYGFK